MAFILVKYFVSGFNRVNLPLIPSVVPPVTILGVAAIFLLKSVSVPNWNSILVISPLFEITLPDK